MNNHISDRDIRYIKLKNENRNEKSLFKKLINAMLENPGKSSIVAKTFNISPDSVYTAISKYCIEEEWFLGKTIGNSFYLSTKYYQILEKKISFLVDCNECPSASEIQLLMHSLKIEMNKEAFCIALSFNCKPVIRKYSNEVLPPDISTVYKTLKRLGFRALKPSILENGRQSAAYQSNVRHWFETVYTEDLSKNFEKNMIFNCDETSIQWISSKKVYTSIKNTRAITSSTENINGHISAMITISNNYIQIPPFIIVGNKKKVPKDLLFLEEQKKCFLMVSKSGFMNSELFQEYINFFIRNVYLLKNNLNLPEELPVLLFLDSHSSRCCPEALKQCQRNNITVITFPSHLTHVLQPFDVVIAAPLKSYIKSLLRRYKKQFLDEKDESEKLNEKEKQKIIIFSLLDGFSQASTMINLEQAFKKTGLVPYNPNKVLQSPYLVDDSDTPLYPNGRLMSRDRISSRIITLDSVIEDLEDNLKDL